MIQLYAPELPGDFPGNSASGFVLAGGRSSRMGTDKALELFGDIPLIQNALNLLRPAVVSVRIAGSRSPLSAFAETIPDTFPDSGPLGGIHAALSAPSSDPSSDWNVFLPVDMPMVPSSLLACLMQSAQATQAPVTAATLNDQLEPFPVVLHRSVLPQITQRLQSGDLACHSAWRSIPQAFHSELNAIAVESLSVCPHPLDLSPQQWFESANTPADLARLNRFAFESKTSNRHLK